MQTVLSYTPLPGQNKQINLIYQSGQVEVVNDTNYALYVQFNTGTVLLPPGVAQLYPFPKGGGVLILQTSPQLFYDNVDQGPMNVITVNQYLDGEISGDSYPMFLGRSAAVAVQLSPVVQTGTVAAISSGLTVTAVNPLISPNAQLYLWGWDLAIDQESASHAVNVTVAGLICGSFSYYYRTQTTVQTDISKRYQNPIVASGLSNVSVGFPAVSGGTARATLTVFCQYT